MKIYYAIILFLILISCSSRREIGKGNWVTVKGGEFIMGCHDSTDYFSNEDEKPAHKVIVDDFLISKYEVTVEEYRNFCDSTGREMPQYEPQWGWIANHPIVSVTLEDAIAYAKWKGARLPTEIEWEYAAQGGNQSHGYRYSGGNSINEVGWCNENSRKQTNPVGIKKPNDLGLYDMSGNVYEWCSNTFYQYDSTKLNKFPHHIVIRGGSYADPSSNCRITTRVLAIPSLYNYWLGFRIAKTIK